MGYLETLRGRSLRLQQSGGQVISMGMCSEMLTAIRQTNALAVHATPELKFSATG